MKKLLIVFLLFHRRFFLIMTFPVRPIILPFLKLDQIFFFRLFDPMLKEILKIHFLTPLFLNQISHFNIFIQLWTRLLRHHLTIISLLDTVIEGNSLHWTVGPHISLLLHCSLIHIFINFAISSPILRNNKIDSLSAPHNFPLNTDHNQMHQIWKATFLKIVLTLPRINFL